VPPEPEVVDPAPDPPEPDVPDPFFVVEPLPVVVGVVVLVVVLVVVAVGAVFATAFAATLVTFAFAGAAFGTDVADRLFGPTAGEAAGRTNVAVSTWLTASGSGPSPIGEAAVSMRV